MTREQLIAQIIKKRSFLSIGLDPDVRKMPPFLLEEDDPIFSFNKKIIDHTQEYCVAYKLNVAYYETMGSFGMKAMEKTINYIRENYPEQFVIVDAKCSEINNAAEVFARNFFELLKVDALTVMPYAGKDSLKPVLKYPNKWLILVTLTPNQSAEEFQLMKDEQGEYLFERVIRKSKTWENDSTFMYFVGSHDLHLIEKARLMAQDAFIFVPADDFVLEHLDDIFDRCIIPDCGMLLNLSQSLIYADKTEMFAIVASQIASDMRQHMFNTLNKHKIIVEN